MNTKHTPVIAGTDNTANRRTFLLAALGVATGVGIAGYGLFTATGTTTLFVPSEYVATVNAQPLSRIDFIANLQSTYATDLADATRGQRQSVLDAMVQEELLVQRARELDVASVDPDIRAAMARAVEEQAAASVADAIPVEGKLRAFFDAHRAQYAHEGRMAVLDFIFMDRSTAMTAVAMAHDDPANPADRLVAAGGRKSGKVDGTEFYFAARLHLGDTLFAQACELPDGGVSAPINGDGVHVLMMVRNRPPEPLDYIAARPRVLADYRRDAIARRQAQEDAFLRKRASIVIAPDLQ